MSSTNLPNATILLAGKLSIHIASPVFSAPRNCGYKREFLDWADLTA